MLSCKLPSNLLYGNREVGWSSISVVSHASMIHDVVFHPTDLDYLVQDLRMIGHFWPGLRENAFRSLLRFKTQQSPWRSKMILGCLRPCATRDLRHSHWHCINRMDATLNDKRVFFRKKLNKMRTCILSYPSHTHNYSRMISYYMSFSLMLNIHQYPISHIFIHDFQFRDICFTLERSGSSVWIICMCKPSRCSCLWAVIRKIGWQYV